MSATDEITSAAETVEDAAVAVVESVERHATAVVGLSFVFAFLLALLLGVLGFESAARIAQYAGLALMAVEAAVFAYRVKAERAAK